MEIKGNIEVQGFTRIDDLDDGTVFVFLDENEPMLKGSDYNGNIYAIQLSNGEVLNAYEGNQYDRPVRQIKAVLTVE